MPKTLLFCHVQTSASASQCGPVIETGILAYDILWLCSPIVAIIVSLLQEKSDRWQVASFVILCHPEGPLSIWMMPGQFFILLNT